GLPEGFHIWLNYEPFAVYKRWIRLLCSEIDRTGLMVQTLRKCSNSSDNLKGNIPVKSSTAFAHLHQIPNNGVNY
ncbi:hypothetical protein QHH03_15695, partial [Aphanizomenon sp. 202]|nr:hypothetical protein [Aphanizomenon sp. 202]